MADSIWDLISMRSFSSLWFWLFIGVFWARVMQAPMGVPVDLVRQAQMGEPEALADLEALSGVRIHHEQAVARSLGIWRGAAWAFALALLAGLAFVYGVELAQAGFAIVAPFALVQAFTARAAVRMAQVPDMPALIRAHKVLRRQVQAVGVAAVFLTTIFGMLHLLTHAML